MAIDFKFFKASKKDFDTINNNPLCKIVDIDVFKEMMIG